ASLRLRSPSHYRGSECLYNLSIAPHDRIKQRGSLSDIGEATKLYRAALLPIPTGHSHRSIAFDSLAFCNSLQTRFQQRGASFDLNEALEILRDTLLLVIFLILISRNLANSLRERFKHWGDPSDLDEVIELHWDALLHFLYTHSYLSSFLNNLTDSLRDRLQQFQQQGAAPDLDGDIEHHRAALHLYPPLHRAALLRPPGQPDRSMSFNNLSAGFRDRPPQQYVPSDIDELGGTALLIHPLGHPDRCVS
ncbi:hypothetical protein BDR06DRAFT_827537, partial [Suillus hirtellus]